MKGKILLLGVTWFLCVPILSQAQEALLRVSDGNAPPGGTASILLELVDSSIAIYDVQGVITFDPDVMQINADSIEGQGNFVIGANLFVNLNNEQGRLEFGGWYIDGFTSGGILSFEAMAVGPAGSSCPIDLEITVLRDAQSNDVPYSAQDGVFSVVETAVPIADFEWSPVTPAVNQEVQFIDKSVDPDGIIVAWEWNFGDGSLPSNLQNPTHIYENAGTYTVTLTVTDNDGATSSVSYPVTVVGPRADFSFYPLNPTINDTVEFHDRSSSPLGKIRSWLWDFGDGTSSSEQNPTHKYPRKGEFIVTLTIEDETGARARASKKLVVVNAPPTANFMFSPENPKIREVVTFDASGSKDPDGNIVSYEWDFDEDGITESTGRTVQHAFDTPGPKRVTLTVTDDDGESSTITRIVPVEVKAPIASFTFEPDQPRVGEEVTFNAEGSHDPDGEIVLFAWDFDDDGEIDATGITTKWAFMTPGNHPVTLTVTDDDGAVGVTTKNVPVQSGPGEGENEPPTADFSFEPQEPKIGEPVTFTADGCSDPDGEIVAYEWDFNNDGTYEAMGMTVIHTFLTGGAKIVTLRVMDDKGAAAFATKVIPVQFVAPIPDFTFSPAKPVVDEVVIFDASPSQDPDGEVDFYEWDFDGDGETDITGRQVTHKFSSPGRHAVTLTVTDNEGNTASVTKTVLVESPSNQPPEARFSYTPLNPTVGDEIHFVDESTDPDGEIVAWLWDFGDGSSSTEQNPVHTYEEPGTYTVTLTVTDDDGASNSVQEDIIVTANKSPTITSLRVSTPRVVSQPITFTAVASDPEGDEIVGWEWDFNGDGVVDSTAQPPVEFVYNEPGFYTVKVRAKDAGSGEFGPWGSAEIYIAPPGGSGLAFIINNPVRGPTSIKLIIPEGLSKVRVMIFDLLGRLVLEKPVVSNEFNWDLTDANSIDVPSGLYFFVVVAEKDGKPIRSRIGRILVIRQGG